MGVFRVRGVGNRVQGVGSEFTENANVQEGVFCCIFCLLFGFFLLILWLKC